MSVGPPSDGVADAPGHTVTAPGDTVTAPGDTVTTSGETVPAAGDTITAADRILAHPAAEPATGTHDDPLSAVSTAGTDPVAATIAEDKKRLRTQLLAARRGRSAADRARAQLANSDHLMSALRGARVVATYLPLPSEPLHPTLPDRLVAAGLRVLVPVVRGAAPLEWVHYHPGLDVRPGPLGIPEPSTSLAATAGSPDAAVGTGTGASPASDDRTPAGGTTASGPYPLVTADAVLIPALAVDGQGFRLGRGGGHYDRSLARALAAGRTGRLIAILFDGEVLAAVPHDDLDIPVDAMLTPSSGIVDVR